MKWIENEIPYFDVTPAVFIKERFKRQLMFLQRQSRIDMQTLFTFRFVFVTANPS